MDDQKDEEVLKAAVGLLGDLGQTFGTRMQAMYRLPFVMSVVKEGTHFDPYSLSMHPIITSYRNYLSMHFINAPYQPTPLY